MDFEKRYRALNEAQQQAVDSLDGPVMVIAGPGTGKTELLSVRVANILKKTDTLPQNILCLTFTESAAHAMRERLASLIGADAYKVSIHTFHSFGSEIINRFGEYFYHGAHFRPADELSTYEVLLEIFEKLPHSNPLAKKMNDEFTFLRDTQGAISDLKKSGLTSDELLAIIEKNEAYTTWLQPKLHAAFADRLSKKSFDGVEELVDEMSRYQEAPYDLLTYEPLYKLAHTSLETALEDSRVSDSTKPLSAWKRAWCEKREDGELTLKDAKRSHRLQAVAGIYYEYLVSMQQRGLFDFDDMILRVVHALEIFNDLRLNLQEQYSYIMVDEFQDTNDAQMRLVWNLTNNPVDAGRPNIMVVGDDDQAIYRFQGANISNILDFHTLYTDVKNITLKDNYRSDKRILDVARSTIIQADQRLETSLKDIDKTLNPHHTPDEPSMTFGSYNDEASEYSGVAKRVANDIAKRPKETHAIIARNHRQLREIIPFLQRENVPMSYDQKDNALESPPVRFLELLARIVTDLGQQRLGDAESQLPELLAHPAWDIKPDIIWKLSLESYNSRQSWIETMLESDGKLHDIAEWLIVSAHIALVEPLEYTLDHLTGTVESQVAETEMEEEAAPDSTPHEGFKSPLRDWFFAAKTLEKSPTTYVSYLGALSTIRHKLRESHSNEPLKLAHFIEFIETHHELGIPIQTNGHVTEEGTVVELLSAHRSKGLEFDNVSIVSLSDNVWGEGARSRAKLIQYPHNLTIGTGGDSTDERLRLLFVALTRAKTHLHLSTHRHSAASKELLPIGYLAHHNFEPMATTSSAIDMLETKWHHDVIAMPKYTMKELLTESLKHYKLSATHLGNFLDVSRGGPELFLLQNLLRFPQGMNPSAAFGSAIHATLQRAHGALQSTRKKRPLEDLLGDFETELGKHQLQGKDFELYSERGADALSAFLGERYDTFKTSQRVEINFSTETIKLSDAVITGAIDLMDVNDEEKTIVVTDYKTGKPVPTWKARTEYEKIKLHHYKQQLMFYKLLIENSRQYSGYTVSSGIIEFIEPDSLGRLHRLELDYDKEELRHFQSLIQSVWTRIQQLDFTFPSTYPENIKGIEQFEADIT